MDRERSAMPSRMPSRSFPYAIDPEPSNAFLDLSTFPNPPQQSTQNAPLLHHAPLIDKTCPASGSRNSTVMSSTPNPFSDPPDALPDPRPATRGFGRQFCSIPYSRGSRVQVPSRTHQAAVPSMSRGEFIPYHSRQLTDLEVSRQTSDLSRQKIDLEEGSTSKHYRVLTSTMMLWSAAVMAQLGLLSAAAAVAVLFRNIGINHASTGDCTWLAISIVLCITSAVAASIICNRRHKGTLARDRRAASGASLDSQWHLLQDVNPYQHHHGKTNLSSISESHLPQAFGQSQSSSHNLQLHNSSPAIKVENPSLTNAPDPGRLWGRQSVAGYQKTAQRMEDVDPGFHQKNNGVLSESSPQISLDHATQNQNPRIIPQALPRVLFAKPLVPLPLDLRPSIQGQGPEWYNHAQPQEPIDETRQQSPKLVDKISRRSTIDLDKIFGSPSSPQELETSSGYHEGTKEDAFPYNIFRDPSHHRKTSQSLFDTFGTATESSSPQFIIGPSEPNSPVQSPFTSYDKLQQFCVSPSYSCEPNEPVNLHSPEPLGSNLPLEFVEEGLHTLTGEERRMYFEQQRRCFSIQQPISPEKMEDSVELDEILDYHPSMEKSVRGKGKEVVGRSVSVMGSNVNVGMANPLSPFDLGPAQFPQRPQRHLFSALTAGNQELADQSQQSLPKSKKSVLSGSTPKELKLSLKPQRKNYYNLPRGHNRDKSEAWVGGMPTKIIAQDSKGDEVPVSVKTWRRSSKAVADEPTSTFPKRQPHMSANKTNPLDMGSPISPITAPAAKKPFLLR